MARLLLILSVERTGSNVVVEGVARFPGLRTASELLNPRGVYGLGALGTVDGLAKDDGPGTQAIRMERDADPVAWLRSIAPDQWWAFKVLNGQLTPPQLRKVIGDAAALLFVTRGRLARHVSLLKAEARDIWTARATRALQPRVNVPDFLRESSAIDRWYATCAAAARERRLPFASLSYEDDVSPGFDHLLDRLARTLAALNIPAGTEVRGPSSFRQQDAGGIWTRMAEGAALRDALHAAGRLDYALTAPDPAALLHG
ncbi:MAG: hypothetical protein ACU0DW_01080 [Shimia sp.]